MTEVSVGQIVEMAKAGKKEFEFPEAMRVFIDGKPVVVFGVLCDTCKVIVSRYIEHVGQILSKPSSTHEKKEDDEEN